MEIGMPGAAFERVQFVGLEVCTDGCSGTPESSNSPFSEGPDSHLDVKARVDLVAKMLRRVRDCSEIDPDSATLKVVMAPEYLFRGRWAAYNVDDVFGVEEEPGSLGLQRQLASLVSPPEWSDWLCVFGTVVCYRMLPEGEELLGRKYEIINVSLVQQGGADHTCSDHAMAIGKHFKGGNDFVFADHGDKQPASGSVPMLSESSIFALGGIDVGVEICMDHSMSRLKRASSSELDIHLITSAGVKIMPKSLCLKSGGFVFQCDGITRRNRRPIAISDLRTLEDGKLRRIPAACHVDAFGQLWEDEISGWYSSGWRPQISIYPPVQLPS